MVDNRRQNNILELCLSHSLGGLELHMQDFARTLQLPAVVRRGSRLHALFVEQNLPHHAIGRRSFLRLARIVDELEIDVIHLQWTRDIPVAVLARLASRRRPLIVQTRNMHITRYKSDIYHRFLYHNMRLIAGISQQVNRQLHTYIPEDVRPEIITWYLGVRPPRLLSVTERQALRIDSGLREDEFVVCSVARVEPQKGQHIVLQAVQKLRDEGIPARAVLVGPAMDEAYYAGLQKDYPQDVFTGFSWRANDYIQIADCKVLATDNETFGMAIMEAMRCGVCVLGSDSGGPLESIEDMRTGLHFRTMDSTDLYRKLRMLVQDPGLKQSLAKAGKTKADQEYDSSTQFRQLLAIMQNLRAVRHRNETKDK